MAAKGFIQSSSAKHGDPKRFWQKWLLLLAMVPLGVGLLLIISSFTGFLAWGTPRKQVVMGGLYILFSFVASNAIQKQWILAAGWTLLGLAAWLILNQQETVFKIIAAAFLGISVPLLMREFLGRRRRYLEAKDANLPTPNPKTGKN
jgi:hypothetical protein